MKNFFLIILIGFFLKNCATPAARLNIINAVPYGSSVEKVCDAKNLNYIEKREFPWAGTGPVIDLCTSNSYIEFNKDKKTMIVVGKNAKGGNAGGYFVFENVNKPLNCNPLFCIYGDGRFKHVATSLDDARIYADPELLVAYQIEQEKIRKEQDRLAQIKAKEDERLAKIQESKLIAEAELAKKRCGSKINLDWSWKYDDSSFIKYMTATFKSQSDSAIKINSLKLYAGEKEIFSSPKDVVINPYRVVVVSADVTNVNRDLVTGGSFSCSWATSVNNNNSTSYNIPKQDSSSGAKDFLKKIIGK
jgi:hypothetical protein